MKKKQTLFRVTTITDDKINTITRKLRMMTGDPVSRSQALERVVAEFDLEKLEARGNDGNS
jgi:hypothetical protein